MLDYFLDFIDILMYKTTSVKTYKEIVFEMLRKSHNFLSKLIL